MLGDKWFEYSVPGNIHYAYVGRAAGFTPQELHLGASWAEIRDPDHDGQPGQIRIPLLGGFYFDSTYAPTWYDSPYDYWAIEFGSALYDKYGTDVTVAEFKELLEIYAPCSNKCPHRLYGIGIPIGLIPWGTLTEANSEGQN